jgi:hypothetical protein
MAWADNRIKDYQHGKRVNWLERRMLEHANPVHFPMACAASIGFVYGLWAQDWLWIIGSSALALLGHVYCWTRKGENARREPGLPRSNISGLKTT